METINDDHDSNERLTEIEYKYPMLSFEKQIFMDAFEKDALIIMAKYVLRLRYIISLCKTQVLEAIRIL